MSNQINGKSVSSLVGKVKSLINTRKTELDKLSKILDFLERRISAMDAATGSQKIIKITKVSNEKSYDIIKIVELSGSVFMEKYGMIYFSGEVFSFKNGEFSYSRSKSVGIDLDKIDDYKFETISDDSYKQMLVELVDKMA